jgi:hypothetical protein
LPRRKGAVALGPSTPKLDVTGITDAPAGPNEPDSETKKEGEDLARQERLTLLLGIRQDIEERKTYANRVFWLVVGWLVGGFALLVAQGALSPWHWFNLDNTVLMAAIGGTTVNVIGIFIVVARYLFPRRPDELIPQRRVRR